MIDKAAIRSLVAEVLDGTELQLKLDWYRLQDAIESGDVEVQCGVHHATTGEKRTIQSVGVGLVDAVFQGLVEVYSGDFPSLKTIRFAEFSVLGDMESGRDSARTDSEVEATLRVANSDGRECVFTHNSKSLTRACVLAVVSAVEFFINSERAFIQVFRALQHAREQNRADSIQRYTDQLTTLVEATSYTEVIEQIRTEELGE